MTAYDVIGVQMKENVLVTAVPDNMPGGAEALAKIREELGVQNCPRCNTSIEKIEWCIHMICEICA
jgi:hypothetical protein